MNERKRGTGMNKTLWAATAALAASPSARREAADKVTLQLKWVTQAQFAGYYVAKDKGLYEAAGLDVTINRAGRTSRRRR